jgi:transposase
MEIPGEITSKLNGKVYNGQSREIVAKVMDFMDAEARSDKVLIDLKKVRERVTAATGASKSTQTRIRAEKRNILQAAEGKLKSFETPNKNRKRPKRVTGLDEFDLGAVRRIVNNFYLVEKCLPTVSKIRAKMMTELNFNGSKTSVRRILRKIGFKWRKTNSNKSILMEKHDVAYKRFVFLKKIRQYRAEGRPIVYTDESYIDSSHVSTKGWSDGSKEGIAAPITKGKRLIFLHAGGEMGFIKDCLVMWQASHKTGDYHDNMNYNNYVKWLNEKLIPNLPPKSVIVVDNASYHNVQTDKTPNSNSKKEDMQRWLQDKNIPFSTTMLKIELYDLIKAHKPNFIRYAIDELLKKHEFEVLRLPPYHPELNPIELVWAQIKNSVARKNVTFNMHDIEKLTRDTFETVTTDDWKKKCENAKKFETKYLGDYEPLANAVESFVVNLGADSSDEDSPI